MRRRPPVLGLTVALLAGIALACGEGEEGPTTEPDKPTMEGAGTKDDPYQASCSNYGKDLEGEVGASFYVSCPADCTTGSVWGTGPYTRDTRICTAGIHAGAIPTSGGLDKASIAEGKDSYEGSEANGVTSREWASYETSLAVEAGEQKAAATPKPKRPAAGEGPGVLENDTKIAGPSRGKAGKAGKAGKSGGGR